MTINQNTSTSAQPVVKDSAYKAYNGRLIKAMAAVDATALVPGSLVTVVLDGGFQKVRLTTNNEIPCGIVVSTKLAPDSIPGVTYGDDTDVAVELFFSNIVRGVASGGNLAIGNPVAYPAAAGNAADAQGRHKFVLANVAGQVVVGICIAGANSGSEVRVGIFNQPYQL